MLTTRHFVSLIPLLTAIAGTAAAQTQPTQPPPSAQPPPAQLDPSAPAPPPQQQPAPLAPTPLDGPAPQPVAPAPYEPAPLPPAYDVPPPPMPPPEHERHHGHEGSFSLGVTWNIGFPVGSVHDHTGKVSGVGFELLGKYWVHSHVTIGIDVDWQTYVHSRPRTTYQIPNGAVTATAYNSLQTGAVRAGADFFFIDEGMFLPFAGLNIGYGWSTFETDVADIQVYDNEDSVVIGAELGLALSFGRDAPIGLLFGRYSIQPAAEFLDVVDDIQAITIQVGLMSP